MARKIDLENHVNKLACAHSSCRFLSLLVVAGASRSNSCCERTARSTVALCDSLDFILLSHGTRVTSRSLFQQKRDINYDKVISQQSGYCLLLTFEALMSSSARVSEIDLRLLKADSRAVLQMR